MTPEQLLQPRYEVIADYPNSPFKVGEVLNFKEIYPFSGFSFDIPHLGIVAPEYFDKYPRLFRKLEWYEHRKPEDMPEYLIGSASDIVYKVDRYDFETNTIYINGNCQFTYTSFIQTKLPATAAEYEEYVNNKNNQQ